MLPLRQQHNRPASCTTATGQHASFLSRATAWRSAASRQSSHYASSFSQRSTVTKALFSHSAAVKRTHAVAVKAYLPSDGSGGPSKSDPTQPGQLKVLVVGASPAGLAAAVSLAQQAGCAVEVHDSRPDPQSDKHTDNSSTLVALGEWSRTGAVHRLLRQRTWQCVVLLAVLHACTERTNETV